MNKTTSSATADGWRSWQVLPSSRRLTQWTFAAMRLVLLLASLFLITWVANFNPVSWDLSEERLFSISAQSRTVLGMLDTPVKLTAFVAGGKDPAVQRLLLAYADESKHVSYRLVDPEAEPALAMQLNVREYGTLIVEGSGRVQRAATVEEPEITNAILAVTRGEPVPVCMLTGHGERAPSDRERGGLSAAATALAQTNYELRLVNLSVDGEVPGECRVVVLAGPTSDVLPIERAALSSYLQAGGRVMLLLESQVAMPEMNALLSEYGVRASDDFVIDTRRNGQQFGLGLQAPMVDQYEPHPVTEDFRLMTMFNLPRSVMVEGVAGIEARPLAKTTASSWGETTFDRSQGATWDADVDMAGPLALVVAVATAVEETPRTYRDRMKRGEPAPVGDPILVVAGDVDFASNSLFGWSGNGDLFVNSINWLAGQQELISILPKEVANKRIVLTDSRKALSFALLVILLPMFPAVTGVVMMVKKVK